MRFLLLCYVVFMHYGCQTVCGKKDVCSIVRMNWEDMQRRLCDMEDIFKEFEASMDEDDEARQGDEPSDVNKKALQSSTHGDAVAARAIDGHWIAKFSYGSCTMTKFESDPWWKAVFEAPVKVSKLYIQNREDCCADRFHKLLITVDGQYCNQYHGPGMPGEQVLVPCLEPLVGREVKIEREVEAGVLTLCEVQIL